MPTPLDGITIVDLTHVLAGPFASMTLKDLGARVIKVERPGIGDDTRAFPPFLEGESGYFAAVNHGKSSIALDLKAAEDRAILDDLLARADVVLENFRPGVMERLGYGWETLHARYPRLIYGAVSGFGHSGPWAEKPCYDMIVQAMGGVMSITGEAGRDPVRVGASIGDIVAGMNLTSGILAALYQRVRTGEGVKVDVAMLDSQLAILEHAIAITHVTGVPPKPTGARHPSIAPFETYRTSDGLIVIAAGNDALFARLAAALDRSELAEDEAFATNAARVQNARRLKREMEVVLLQADTAHWLKTLEAAGVPVGPIRTLDQVLHGPQLNARNMVATVAARGDGPEFLASGNPIKLSSLEDSKVRPAAPALDGDRADILEWIRATPIAKSA